ncbi:hypothetical protein [Paraburkholderia sp. J11-2]|uniref:hypothetical protein n=1 Tax=Paraburkholderia sp. J11-2 TaxID=2805431 RepID=UPI002AB7F1A0|nr:hypothetical protein [Paraburkholderia sp. J11-2]
MNETIGNNTTSGRVVNVSGIATVIAVILGAFVTISTLYGIHRFYTPIPYWDEWDGYLGFYITSLESGGFHNWWANHMEHRIVTSRALFWLDLRFFHGNHILLFATILTTLAAIVFTISRQSREVPRAWSVSLGLAFAFAWVQREVLVWGFETQVVAAYFFSILACALFCRFEKSALIRFVTAYSAAALAEFSMANGLGVYALLFGATLLARRPLIEKITTAIVGVVMIAVYFIGYVPPELPAASADHGLLFKGAFVSLFMANPLAMVGLSVPICVVIGAVTLSAAVAVSLRIYVKKEATPYRTFLICIYVSVLLSALAVTKGRSAGGLMGAVAGRYTTGPLIAWWVLALLLFDYLRNRAARSAVMLISVALATGVAFGQRLILDDFGYLYSWKLAVLSNRIGMERKDLTAQIFPQDPERAPRFESRTAYASTHHIGYYSQQWLRDAGQVKFDPAKVESGWCTGMFENAKNDGEGIIAGGWAASRAGSDALIVLTASDGETIGYGVTGMRRDDVRQAVPGSPKLPGWVAFAKAGTSPADAYVYANERFCKLRRP